MSIPLRHTAVTGQSQQAGKTTALEALIERSGLRALTFITKRGESAFQGARPIPAYFREQADWRYVAAILEATLHEKLKFERSWIMTACKGAARLADVQRNVKRSLEKARGLNQSVLTTLDAYLDIVVPQIRVTRFATEIELSGGVNMMDLSALSLELQSLVIRSSIEWIYEREANTIVIIPEAWEFLPQQRGSPVKLAAEQLIRKGAASKNFVWLDSQDIAGVHKDILRQVPVWLLGVQRERNEVKRTLAHMSGLKKPSIDDVMQLGLGEFFVCHGAEIRKVYARPVWMTEWIARGVARGEVSRNRMVFNSPMPTPATNEPEPDGLFRFSDSGKDEIMWKERYEELQKAYDTLNSHKNELVTLLTAAEHRIAQLERAGVPIPQVPANISKNAAFDRDEMYNYFLGRLKAEPALLALAASRPELRVNIERRAIEIDESSLRGKLCRLIAEGFYNSTTTAHAAFIELKRRGISVASASVYREMDNLAAMGIVTKEAKEGYRKNPEAIVTMIEAA